MEMKDTLSSCSDLDEQEIQQLQLNKETLHEKDFNSDLSTRLQRLHSNGTSNLQGCNNSKMDSIEKCIVERARHEQEIQNRLKRLNERKLQIQECKIQEVKASNACLGDTNNSRIVSDKGNDQSLENQSNTSRDKSSMSRNECNDKSTSRDDTDIRPSYDTEPMAKVSYTAEYNVFAVETQHSEQPESINDTHRVALANLIASLKLDNDENKKIQNQLKKANASLTQELKECNSTLEETNRTLRESNSTRDSYLIALKNKQTELETYKTLNDQTVYYYKLELVKEKHDELFKQIRLTKSHYEGLVKEKTKAITDLELVEFDNSLDHLSSVCFELISRMNNKDNNMQWNKNKSMLLNKGSKILKATLTITLDIYNELHA
ncbi:hypothetical protein Tco_1318934 [Tanacetum coccineum]